MASQGVGGLYATVSLDIGAALAELNKLDAKFKQVFRQTSSSGATGGLNQLAAATNNTNAALSKTAAAGNQAAAATKKVGNAAREASKDTQKLGQRFKGFSDDLSTTLASFGAARSGNVFYALSSGLQALTRSSGGAAGGMTLAGAAAKGLGVVGVGLIATLGGIAFGLKKLTSASNASAANLERLGVSFESLLGSAGRARSEINFLIQAAKISPFFTEDIIALDRFLLAQGVLDDGLRRGITQRLIDFGAAAGLTGDKLQDLSYALGQVYNAGRLTGDEMRQLRNNFLGAQLVLRSLPRYAELTGEELKKAIESGAISSQDFFEAFFAYTEKFGSAAAAQAQTFLGLKDTLVDVFKLGLGEANLALGRLNRSFSPLENLKGVLRELLFVVERIDFKPLVASIGALVNAVLGPFISGMRTGGEFIVNLFQVYLPAAVLFAVNYIRVGTAALIVSFRTIFQAIGLVIRSIVGMTNAFIGGANHSAGAFQFIARAVLLASVPIIALISSWAVSLSIVITLVRTLIALFTGGVPAAADALMGGMRNIGNFIAGVADGVASAWTAIDNLEPVTLDDLFPDIKEFNPTEDLSIGSDAFPAAGSGDGGKASAAAKAMEKAMNTLFEMTRRWFGLRSELEEGFLGKEGFEATVDNIAATGKKLIETLKDITGTSGLVTQVTDATQRLMDLAKQREEVAAALSDAEKALNKAIDERDDFAAKIRQSSIEFANSLKTETDTVRQFQLFSDRGFFFETEQKKQKSFVESLRERLDALRNFLANIKKLRSLGLDEGLLQSLVEAGPEQSGEVAAALAQGGQAMIAEVNVLQSAVTSVADELADFGADAFFDAGVEMAEANVSGLTDSLGTIESAATAIVEEITNAVLPLAEEMNDAGKAGGEGLASGLQAGTSGIGDILDSVVTEGIHPRLAGIKADFGALPGSFVNAINRGKGPVQEAFDKMLAGMENSFGDWAKGQEKDHRGFWETIKELWRRTTAYLGPAWGAFWDTLKASFGTAWNGIIWIVEKAANIIILGVELLANRVVDAVNVLIRAFNALPFPDIGLVSRVSLNRISLDDVRWSPTPSYPGLDTPGGTGLNFQSTGVPNVNVYIGETELKDIVKVEISDASSTSTRTLVSGSRL